MIAQSPSSNRSNSSNNNNNNERVTSTIMRTPTRSSKSNSTRNDENHNPQTKMASPPPTPKKVSFGGSNTISSSLSSFGEYTYCSPISTSATTKKCVQQQPYNIRIEHRREKMLQMTRRINRKLSSSSSSFQDYFTSNESTRERIMRRQRQRLLLLRHSAQCTHDSCQQPHHTEPCPVTPYCASLKRLWDHITDCSNETCSYPHCKSSRYVLSHYNKCYDMKCQVCSSVREAIAKEAQHKQPQSQQPQPQETKSTSNI